MNPPAILSEDLIRAAAAAAPVTASSRTDDIPPSWDERTVLASMLDYVRDTVHVKCAGLTDEQARRAPLPGSPLTTISGLVSHLRAATAPGSPAGPGHFVPGHAELTA